MTKGPSTELTAKETRAAYKLLSNGDVTSLLSHSKGIVFLSSFAQTQAHHKATLKLTALPQSLMRYPKLTCERR